jgi:polyisoprenoid-binding protein YceI
MSNVNDLTPGTWNIDASHSTVGFTARHLMITKVHGTFTGVSGTITVAENRLASAVQATIDTTSVSTGDAGRDGHLKGADFFDTEKFPTMTFASTEVVEKGSDFVLRGDLTIKGVSKPVELALEFEGAATDPWGNSKAAFSASTEINRKDWGLDFNVALETGGVLVGEKIKISLDIQAVKA